mmetsp:Transcript_39267/g.108221  ORF Transcript_39267/g.108221 Transcript_39267/m.108221 type:complete len:262 (+) Transcript_39267:1843-2628(+)
MSWSSGAQSAPTFRSAPFRRQATQTPAASPSSERSSGAMACAQSTRSLGTEPVASATTTRAVLTGLERQLRRFHRRRGRQHPVHVGPPTEASGARSRSGRFASGGRMTTPACRRAVPVRASHQTRRQSRRPLRSSLCSEGVAVAVQSPARRRRRGDPTIPRPRTLPSAVDAKMHSLDPAARPGRPRAQRPAPTAARPVSAALRAGRKSYAARGLEAAGSRRRIRHHGVSANPWRRAPGALIRSRLANARPRAAGRLRVTMR